ncbi:MAG: ATP-binding protein [Deltaproteobacteria bacterium]|nr:ATP-binding protein [Deltaproteobacteria bacterium]
MGKTFKFDVIIGEEDMCDREPEKKRILSLMKRNGRIIIYSLRRMGKTSLVDVCSKKMRSIDSEVFHLYVDLSEVASLKETAVRFRSHYEFALKEQFPLKKVKIHINDLLSRLKLDIPGGVELSLEKYASLQPEEYLMSLFQELRKIGEKGPLALIIDEFQGISGLNDAQAILRREVKKLDNAAIVLMGSNQRLLYGMFNNKKSPFFGFGEDLELKPISIGDYVPYMNERFSEVNVSIDSEVAAYMMEKMNGIPNYINELGSWIVDTQTRTQLTKGHIDEALETAAHSKKGRYESALYGYSINQRKFVKAVAKMGVVKSFTGKEMVLETGLSPTELSRIGKNLEDAPILSRDTENRFFILDPFFRKFLEMM